jgi:hypothetical protein
MIGTVADVPSVPVKVRLPADLVAAMDDARGSLSRQGYIEDALSAYLRPPPDALPPEVRAAAAQREPATVIHGQLTLGAPRRHPRLDAVRESPAHQQRHAIAAQHEPGCGCVNCDYAKHNPL